MFLFVGTAVREMTEARKRFLVHWRPYDQICIGLARSGGRVLCVLSGRLTCSDYLTRRVKPVRVSDCTELFELVRLFELAIPSSPILATHDICLANRCNSSDSRYTSAVGLFTLYCLTETRLHHFSAGARGTLKLSSNSQGQNKNKGYILDESI